MMIIFDGTIGDQLWELYRTGNDVTMARFFDALIDAVDLDVLQDAIDFGWDGEVRGDK